MRERKEIDPLIEGINLPLVQRYARLPKVLSLKGRVATTILAFATAISLFACSSSAIAPKEPSSSDTDTVVTQLNTYNKTLSENPGQITTLGPQISLLATDYYCAERNCSSDELKRLSGSFEFLGNDDFQKQSKETNWCTGVETDEETKAGGFYYFRNRKIYLNTERILKNPDGSPRENPGYVIFDFSLHEDGHARPPVFNLLANNQLVPFTGSEDNPPITIQHGIIRLNYTPERNLDGKPCYLAYRKPVEEAVAEYNNKVLLKKLGLPRIPKPAYKTLVDNYEELINKRFNRDASLLFNFHQRSQEGNFVGNIGIALGYPKNVAVEEGDKFLAYYFTPIP